MKPLDITIVILSAIFMLSLLFYLIYGKLTECKFDAIAKKFHNQFGYTPFSMTVGKNGGFFFWGYKESYLLSALFFTKLPATKKMMTIDEIRFFQELHNEETSWLYRKYTALIIALLSFIGLLILLKLGSV